MKKMILGAVLAILGFQLTLLSITAAYNSSSGVSWTTGLPLKGMDTLLIIGLIMTIAGIVICALEAYRKEK